MYLTISHNDKLLEIKFSKRFPNIIRFKNPTPIIVQFKTSKSDEWKYHVTRSKFTCVEEIVQHFIENQESDYLRVKVISICQE